MRKPIIRFACLIACTGVAAAQGSNRAQLDAIDATARSYFGKTYDPGAPLAPTAPVVASRKHHTLEVGGRTLRFTAEFGAVEVEDQLGVSLAQVTYFAYLLDTPHKEKRPVTFAMNGGPGYFSAILHLGGLGPWRLPISQAGPEEPTGTELVANAETWLDFTDLVFIDALGTGYSRLQRSDHRTMAVLLSQQGDIATLSHVLRRWMEEHGRTGAPMVFAGQSYSGMRGSYLADLLGSTPGLMLNGLVLISPAFYRSLEDNFDAAGRMPTVLSIRAERRGDFAPDQLAGYERFVQETYLPGLARAQSDAAAADRLSEEIAAITRLPLEWVKQRNTRRISSSAFLSDPPRPDSDSEAAKPGKTIAKVVGREDSVLSGLQDAVTAMAKDKFGSQPRMSYEIRGAHISFSRVEPLAALEAAMKGDRSLQVLVGQGAFDMTTPYYTNKMLLAPMEKLGGRLRFRVYEGGHALYYRDRARQAFHDDAAAFYEAIGHN